MLRIGSSHQTVTVGHIPRHWSNLGNYSLASCHQSNDKLTGGDDGSSALDRRTGAAQRQTGLLRPAPLRKEWHVDLAIGGQRAIPWEGGRTGAVRRAN
jgi:hypothetical protein